MLIQVLFAHSPQPQTGHSQKSRHTNNISSPKRVRITPNVLTITKYQPNIIVSRRRIHLIGKEMQFVLLCGSIVTYGNKFYTKQRITARRESKIKFVDGLLYFFSCLINLLLHVGRYHKWRRFLLPDSFFYYLGHNYVLSHLWTKYCESFLVLFCCVGKGAQL